MLNKKVDITTKAVGLVCVAHFFSHFNMMMLPPMLPLLGESMQIGYTQIGLALTAYSLVSALTQTPIGYVVDRVGAPKILIAGIVLESLSFMLIGVFPLYAMLIMMLVCAGIGNAVYHPADYSILNQMVPADRIGKAFSYHTASGLLGEAVAPATVLLLALTFGWRTALIAGGLAGVLVATVLFLNRQLFSAIGSANAAQAKSGSVVSLLSLPLVLGLLFFVGISLTTRGVNGFGISALHEGRGMDLPTAGVLLTIWLVSAPIGVLVGGQMADRHDNHATVISASFLGLVLCLGLLATTQPAFGIAVFIFALGGFLAGLVSPSRDMLIRSVTPPGQSGKVFGFVSTGFNLGGMLAPPLYGYLLDSGNANGVFGFAALASLLTIATVIGTRRAAVASRPLVS